MSSAGATSRSSPPHEFLTRRQLIQRLGRVIRRKPDERSARVFVLFVKGTPEDPESKAREDVVAELCEHASSVKILGPGIIE
jgi:RNA polymerase primary sigma factor